MSWANSRAPPPPERVRSFLQHGLSLGRYTAHEGVHAPRLCVACTVINLLVMLVEFGANGWRVEPLGSNWSVGVSAETLVALGAKVTSHIVWRGEWWRLLTASWLHGGLLHLALNLGLLWQLGAPLERAYGWRVAPLYLLSGVYGVVTSALLLPAVVSVGASASCFGLVGAFWGELAINYVATDCSLRGTKVGMLVLFTAASLISGISPVVDNFMHLIGFLTGFLLALVLQARPRGTEVLTPHATHPVAQRAAAPGGMRPVVARHSLAPARAVTRAGGSLFAREWCGGSHRALHVRQRSLRGAGLLLLLVETCFIFAAMGELAGRRTESRAVCRWCSVLNCAPISWWDCSVYEVSLDDVGQSLSTPSLPEDPQNQTAPEPSTTQGARSIGA